MLDGKNAGKAAPGKQPAVRACWKDNSSCRTSTAGKLNHQLHGLCVILLTMYGMKAQVLRWASWSGVRILDLGKKAR